MSILENVLTKRLTDLLPLIYKPKTYEFSLTEMSHV